MNAISKLQRELHTDRLDAELAILQNADAEADAGTVHAASHDMTKAEAFKLLLNMRGHSLATAREILAKLPPAKGGRIYTAAEVKAIEAKRVAEAEAEMGLRDFHMDW